jgi:hypothetical protein
MEKKKRKKNFQRPHEDLGHKYLGSAARVSLRQMTENLEVKQPIDLRMAIERTVPGNGSRSLSCTR